MRNRSTTVLLLGLCLLSSVIDAEEYELGHDQRTLVVADTAGANLWTFRIEADGSLRYKQPYYTTQLTRGQEGSGADGMTVHTLGSRDPLLSLIVIQFVHPPRSAVLVLMPSAI